MDGEEAVSLRLFKKADQTYIWVKVNGPLLTKTCTDNLKHIIRFLHHIKKTKDDTFSRHSGVKEKMHKRSARIETL